MLTKITNDLYIDLSDIYLTDRDEYSAEVLIYIRSHPKIPIVIKDFNDGVSFHMILDKFLDKKKGIINATENVPQTSQDILG